MEEIKTLSDMLAVDIGFPCGPGIMPLATTVSLLKTQEACLRRGVPLGMQFVKGCSLVTTARDMVVDRFLRGPSKYLFWIDADMSWEPQDFIKLLALATRKDVLCGTYPTKNEQRTITVQQDEDHLEMDQYGLLRIGGTGLGFCVMRRSIVEEIASQSPRVYSTLLEREIAAVFRLDVVTDDKGVRQSRGEDAAFFADLRYLGYTIWLDPTIQLGHIGDCEYRRDPAEALRLRSAFQELQVA